MPSEVNASWGDFHEGMKPATKLLFYSEQEIQVSQPEPDQGLLCTRFLCLICSVNPNVALKKKSRNGSHVHL